jgi:hypothetical protein
MKNPLDKIIANIMDFEKEPPVWCKTKQQQQRIERNNRQQGPLGTL